MCRTRIWSALFTRTTIAGNRLLWRVRVWHRLAALWLVVGALLIVGALMGYGVWMWIGIIPLATALMSSCPLYSILGLNTCPMKK